MQIVQVMTMALGIITQPKTVQTWYNYCRDICTHYLLHNAQVIGKYTFIIAVVFHIQYI